MNAPEVRTLLDRNNYLNITTPQEGVLRAERWYQDHPIAVHYFDVSRRFLSSDFRLDQYQDDLLLRDYYTNPGPLQWNYYLYFLYGRESHVDSNVKWQIESDRGLARKLVIAESELEREISQDVVDAESVGLPVDITTTWRRQLQRVGLGDVASRRPYTKVVEEYLDSVDSLCNSSISEEGSSSDPDAETALDFMENVVLNRYRGLSGRSFSFKPVNLIVGPNGIGKTSLLEAIELYICGATARSDGKSEDAEFQIQFRGAPHPKEYRPRDNRFYRARDSVWYGNVDSIGNSLYQGFRRFNFFDSDAAYRLSIGNTSDEVQTALGDLFFGREASWIQERVEGFATRFQGELTARNKEGQAFRRAINETEKELAEIKASLPSEEQLLDSFRKIAVKSNWLGGLPSADVASLRELRGRLEATHVLLSSVRASLPWLPHITRHVLAAEINRTSDAIAHLETLNHDLLRAAQAYVDSEKELDISDLLLQRVALVAPYVSNPHAHKLHGLGDSIRKCEHTVSVLSAAETEVARVKLGRYSKLSESLAHATERIEQRAAGLSAELAALAQSVEDAKDQHSQVQRLIAEITAKAQEFIRLVPDADVCPLCKQKHEGANELVSRISLPDDHDGASGQFNELIAERERTSRDLDSTRAILGELTTIRSASLILLGRDDVGELPLQQLVSSLSGIGEKLASANESLTNLKKLQDGLSEKGLLENEYRELMKWFARQGYTDRIDLSSVEGFTNSQNVLRAERDKLLAQKERNWKHRGSLQNQKADLLTAYWQGVEFSDERKANLGRVLADLKVGADSLSRIAEDLVVNPDEDPASVERRMQQVQSAFVVLAEGLEKLHASEAAQPLLQKKLAEARKQLTKIVPMEGKLVSALEVLRSIGQERSSSQGLCRAIDCNMAKIADIFRRTHVPREFVNVLLDNGVSLQRIGADKLCRLTEVSTGQRSALALSIFLSMNDLLTQGPPYIILDDSLAHTDDLNILSFFDYLLAKTLDPDRKRQIFFSTASQKIGNLFRMKFEGLGEDMFEIIDMTSSIRV